MQVTNLRCEYHTNPLGIDVANPRLSWQLQSDQRGAHQVAYRLQAASTEAGLLAGQPLLWDTGKVDSDHSIHVPYAGPPLASGQRVWWRVQVWGATAGGPAQEQQAASEPAWWEVGLLDRRDWVGEWIGANLAGGPRTTIPCPFLRRSFHLDQPVRSARLYITALGLYEACLNGQRVGEDHFTPGWTDYRKRVQYQVYDVTGLLSPGENVIGAMLGDGWYCGHVAWKGRQLYGDRPRLLAQLHLLLADGQLLTIATGEDWQVAFGPLLESDLLMGESYDARLEMPGWCEPGYDSTGWQQALTFPDPGLLLSACRGPGVRPMEELLPVAPPTRRGSWPNPLWIYDFGQNMVGRVRLKASGPAGATLVLRHAEVLDADGALYTVNLRSARQTDCYTLRGQGQEVYEPRFTFHGFRYVELSGYPGEPPPDLLTAVVLHSDTSPTGQFACSDPLINQLQHNIVWGQKGNFLEVPTDCPQRDERLGWTGDAQVFIRTAAFNKDVASFFTKWQQDLADAQDEDGCVPSTAPSIWLDEKNNGGPAWSDAILICPWTIYLCYADKRLLEKHFPAMERFVQHLIDTSPGLIRSHPAHDPWGGYGDWLSINAETPKDLIGTAFFAHNARLLSHIALVIDKPSEADRYNRLFQDVSRAFNDRFLTPAGLIAGQTQTAILLALHFDLAPEALRPALIAALARDIENRDLHLSTGFVGSPYLPHVLSNHGRLDLAYALLHQKTWPSWLFPVTQGATTIWERWDGWTPEKGYQDPGMNSFNHYAYGAIGDWLYSVVAGIRPDPENPGYKHILLKPQPGGGLSSARASLDSPHGTIASSWQTSGDTFTWDVTIPPNTTAAVYVPAAEGDLIYESGQPVEAASGVKFIKFEPGAAVYAVAAGQYRFTVEIGQVSDQQSAVSNKP